MRRKPTARTRWNYEIAGLAAIGIAVLTAIALILPGARAGYVGRETAAVLHALFGRGALFFPGLVALVGAIVFLEINVPRMIARLGSAACIYFVLADASFGAQGGLLGDGVSRALRGAFGDLGAAIVFVLAAVLVTVWITDVSVKKAIGWCLLRTEGLRARPRAAAAGVPARVKEPPASLREAFALAVVPAAAAGAAAAAPVPVGVAVPPAAPLATVDDDDEDEDDEEDDEDLEVDDDDDDEEVDDDDELDDDEEGDEELEDDDLGDEDEDDDLGDLDDLDDIEVPEEQNGEDRGDAVLVGEYEPPAVAAAASSGKPVYRLPDLALLDAPQVAKTDDTSRAGLLEDTLASFGIGAKVTHIERGPAITRYELRPARGVKISRISALADDLALALAATSVRIEAPIPGKSAVGIEVPNASVSIVAIREILEALPARGTVPPLSIALGKDITGRPVFGDLARMPHLLVAGATGSGKSVCLNGIIASLLASATPDQVQLLMIDPKRVELTVYDGIPHLIEEVITDARLAAGALFEMTKEMDSRYERFAKAGVRKIEEYNAMFPEEPLPYVVIVIDELADLMLIAPAKVETTICRIAQLARATGIHLVVATQRPSVDVITGIIKANIPSRIAFAVSSQIDSRTILDQAGAERLLGRGDMLFLPIDAPKPVRAQGALITGAEVNRLVAFWAAQGRPDNMLDVEVVPIEDDERDGKTIDPLCYEAAKFIIETQYASTAQLQSQFAIGHPRAVRLMKQLEEFKVVGPHEGTKPRRILLGLGELETIAGRLGKKDDRADVVSSR